MTFEQSSGQKQFNDYVEKQVMEFKLVTLN